ncbi:MAG TPA: hypothetical protein VFC18_02875 [Burkholderiales bacterium]|nr:hypothetical protein [Burkholderiales bacterium]
MKRWLLATCFLAAGAALAQDRSTALDRAYEEARAAHEALKAAAARRDQGVEPQPGERIGTAAGGSRPTESYFARQAILEQELEAARRRYEAALRHWNDLK